MQLTGTGSDVSEAGGFRDAYAVFGQPGSTLVIPPAYQVGANHCHPPTRLTATLPYE